MKNKLIFTFLVLIFLVSCQTLYQKRKIHLLKSISENGYSGLKYSFEEHGQRNLFVVFYNDSILEVSNFAKMPYIQQMQLNFKCIYLYRPINITEILILEDVDCNIPKKHNTGYLKPFDYYRTFTIDEEAVLYIFPNIYNDTIRFSADFKKLQIREFCFVRKK